MLGYHDSRAGILALTERRSVCLRTRAREFRTRGRGPCIDCVFGYPTTVLKDNDTPADDGLSPCERDGHTGTHTAERNFVNIR